eukprot:6194708-Pleurochrysis_carterae.AAC.5
MQTACYVSTKKGQTLTSKATITQTAAKRRCTAIVEPHIRPPPKLDKSSAQIQPLHSRLYVATHLCITQSFVRTRESFEILVKTRELKRPIQPTSDCSPTDHHRRPQSAKTRLRFELYSKLDFKVYKETTNLAQASTRPRPKHKQN